MIFFSFFSRKIDESLEWSKYFFSMKFANSCFECGFEVFFFSINLLSFEPESQHILWVNLGNFYDLFSSEGNASTVQ